ncbi:MAG: hypothetical protein JSU05_07420, partial [Bacteroidetes bacterium]|nr:hypothetical protein [Bacteroidota bacterium]
MKKIYTLTIVLIAVLANIQLNAQTNYTFDLGSSFSPSWSAGSTSGTA